MTDTPDLTPEQVALHRVFDEGLVTFNPRDGGVPQYVWTPQGLRRFEQLLDADPNVPDIVSTNAPRDSGGERVGDLVRFRRDDGIFDRALVEDLDMPYQDGFPMVLLKDRYGKPVMVRASVIVRVNPIRREGETE